MTNGVRGISELVNSGTKDNEILRLRSQDYTDEWTCLRRKLISDREPAMQSGVEALPHLRTYFQTDHGPPHPPLASLSAADTFRSACLRSGVGG